MPSKLEIVPPKLPPPGTGSHYAALETKRQKPLTFSGFASFSELYLDVFESIRGRHDWIRTSDLFRVKEAL
jgi:hypothetical protein